MESEATIDSAVLHACAYTDICAMGVSGQNVCLKSLLNPCPARAWRVTKVVASGFEASQNVLKCVSEGCRSMASGWRVIHRGAGHRTVGPRGLASEGFLRNRSFAVRLLSRPSRFLDAARSRPVFLACGLGTAVFRRFVIWCRNGVGIRIAYDREIGPFLAVAAGKARPPRILCVMRKTICDSYRKNPAVRIFR